MTDDSLKILQNVVAKMYVNEIFGGLLPENKPGISTFSNKYKYRQMLGRERITGIFFLRASFFTHYWQSARCVYFKRRSNWAF